ncbi:MAG TPA: LPS assembly lipoprotein LptE [Amoebophilaceae bacterium]|jgi:hypothetical protein|nr:LPS assembly lipoprotein LptE [Amoebophilaceae bacterium]
MVLLKKSLLKNKLLGWVLGLFFMQSCGIFSFSGAALPPDIETFSIKEFHAEISDGPLNLTQQLTEALAKKITQMTTLTQVEREGHIQYEGVIKSFAYKTTFHTDNKEGEEQKEVQRLTITIEVSYVNPLEEENAFEKKLFSASKDMLAEENPLDKEQGLVDEIIQELVEAVCNKSIDIW